MCENKMCSGCPFGFSEESDYVNNLGCLPSPREILQLKKNNVDWQCHSEPHVCQGLVETLTGDSEEGRLNRKFYQVEKLDKYPTTPLMVTESNLYPFMLEEDSDVVALFDAMQKKNIHKNKERLGDL